MKLHWVKFLDRVDDYGTELLDFELNLPGAWAGITSQRVQGGEWRSAFTIRVKPGWVQHGLSTNPGAAKARVQEQAFSARVTCAWTGWPPSCGRRVNAGRRCPWCAQVISA